MEPRRGFKIFLPILVCFLALSVLISCQEKALEQQPTPAVNILFIYQEESSVKYLEAAASYIEKKSNLGIKLGTVHKYLSEATDKQEKLSERFCEEIERMMAEDERPDVAIDFTRISVPSESVKSVLRAMQMPTIAGSFGQQGDVREWRELSNAQQSYLIQISPPADMLTEVVRSLADLQNMTSAVLLHDEHYEMWHKYKSLLQNLPTRHLLTKVGNSTGLYAQIDRLIHVDIVNFFIAASPAQISEVLARATNPEARAAPWFSDEFAWYSMSLGEGTPSCAYCELPVTLAHLTPKIPKSGEDKRRFLQGELGRNLTLTDMFFFDISLNTILAVGAMKKDSNWTHDISHNRCSASNNVTKLSSPDLDLDLFNYFKRASQENTLGKPFILDGNGRNRPQFDMNIRFLTYDPKSPVPKSEELVGVWRANYGEPILLNYTGGLDKHLVTVVFRIVTVVQPPFIYRIPGCNSSESKYKNCYRGYCIDLLNRIEEELHFKYIIREVDSYGYMSAYEPHEWSGMVRVLQDRKADIGLGALAVMAERESVIDFTVPYYDLVGMSILMKKPKEETSLFKFLTVLENDVWLTILGTYFVTSFLMWIFDSLSPFSYRNNREKYVFSDERREFTLKECFWFAMTSLTPQGGGEAPKNLSGKFAAGTWWLFGFIIIASYTANLAAFLTVARLDLPIENLDQLSEQYKVQYAPMVNSSAWVYFDRMARIEEKFYEIWRNMALNDSLSVYDRSMLSVWDYPVKDRYTKLWGAMNANHPPKTREEAVARVRGGRLSNGQKKDAFAFIEESTNLKYIAMQDCELEFKGEEFSRKPYAIGVQKGSPLKESFSHMILKLLNARDLEKLKTKWWTENVERKDCPREQYQSDGISIHNIGGVFIVIFIGIVLACLSLLVEHWWERKRDAAQERAESDVGPPDQEFGPMYTNEQKSNFATLYNKQTPQELPPVETVSW